MVNYKEVNKDKMMMTGKMIKTCLESLLSSKVEFGYTYGADNIYYFYVYDKDSKYNYSKITIEYDENKDDADYSGEIIKMILNSACDYHEAELEEKYIINLLEELEIKELWVMDGELVDSSNMSIDITCLDVMKYDRTECNLILVDQDGGGYEVNLATEKIYEIEEE